MLTQGSRCANFQAGAEETGGYTPESVYLATSLYPQWTLQIRTYSNLAAKSGSWVTGSFRTAHTGTIYHVLKVPTGLEKSRLFHSTKCCLTTQTIYHDNCHLMHLRQCHNVGNRAVYRYTLAELIEVKRMKRLYLSLLLHTVDIIRIIQCGELEHQQRLYGFILTIGVYFIKVG